SQLNAGIASIYCDLHGGKWQMYEFTVKGLIPSKTEYNKMIDILKEDGAYDCIGIRSLEKINFKPFLCPVSEAIGCRKNDPQIYNNCLLDELKEIQNLEENSARQARDLASKKCLSISEEPSMFQKWKYKD
ncbi:hypothetical protein OAC63_01710, partial [Amylibacter sp.]|nr:hypothetical protein [Amylibacter sp.]